MGYQEAKAAYRSWISQDIEGFHRAIAAPNKLYQEAVDEQSITAALSSLRFFMSAIEAESARFPRNDRSEELTALFQSALGELAQKKNKLLQQEHDAQIEVIKDRIKQEVLKIVQNAPVKERALTFTFFESEEALWVALTELEAESAIYRASIVQDGKAIQWVYAT